VPFTSASYPATLVTGMRYDKSRRGLGNGGGFHSMASVRAGWVLICAAVVCTWAWAGASTGTAAAGATTTAAARVAATTAGGAPGTVATSVAATSAGGATATMAESGHAAALPSAAVLADIGRKMFFDPSLSASGRLACANCHSPQYAYGPPPGMAIAKGGKHLDQLGTRAVPSLRYLQGIPSFSVQLHFIDGDIGPGGGFTWDGRAASAHEQARLPLMAPNEMANASTSDFVAKLRKTAYAAEFRAAFGAHIFKDPERAFAAGSMALEAFQQTPAEFYPYSSRYDAFLRGELDLTEQEERGVALFKDPLKGNCASCHLVTSRGGTPPAFTDFDFINVGVPRNPRLPANADAGYFDLGLCGPLRTDLLDKREYCGFFRAPTLRNVALRDAFFHNGVFKTLQEAVRFYVERDLYPEKYYSRNADGGVHKFDDLPPGFPDNVDHDAPLDRKPGTAPALTDAEVDDVIAFLNTLTDGYRAQ
jgi:cytochrome c peroxidase